MIACCFFCKLPVQLATTFQESHVMNIDFNSHDEINKEYSMNNICWDAGGAIQLTYQGALSLDVDTEENLLCWCNLETFLGNKIVIIYIFVYMTLRNFLWNATMWYYLFMSFL